MMQREDYEDVGPNFDIAGMLDVRRRSRAAVHAIAARIAPGMREEDATRVARTVLREHGLLRGWHKIIVRFGANTVREYGNPSAPGVVLAADDIFFIDIGPVWDRWEGDAGETFVVGADPEMHRARADVFRLWQTVHDLWRAERITGRALYEFATREAQAMGWELNLKRMSGHRIADFPHEPKFAGTLSTADVVPSAHVWILEMHIRHKARGFGAFYEDLMMEREIEGR
ncbi:M24 family metallopeptidase [Burkholderia sp. 22PA0106]|uniref:M24 family metallopeptidase n=1 Tax=Burkholderia sp. 22PA0106 TaxID=3237371 RepID=UPI0039C03F50